VIPPQLVRETDALRFGKSTTELATSQHSRHKGPPPLGVPTALLPAGNMGTVPVRHEPCIPHSSEELGVASPEAWCRKEEGRWISAGHLKPEPSNV